MKQHRFTGNQPYIEFTCQGQCPLGQISPLMTLGLKWIWGLPQGTLTEPERWTNKLQFGSVLGEYWHNGFMFPAFCITFQKSPDCSVAIFGLFTLREAGAVVLVQSVSGSTETYVRTIWKLSAKMFTAPVSVAATVGGQTYCEEATEWTQSYHNKAISLFFLLWWQFQRCQRTLVTVVSMETICTFAGIGFKSPSASRSVLTRRRQALIHSCKQEAFQNLSTQVTITYEGVNLISYLCTSSKMLPEGDKRKQVSEKT